jgi:hypothetical protein
MKTRYSFMDPGAIMGIVVGLIVLGVGVFAFFVTVSNIPATTPSATTSNSNNQTWFAVQNVSNSGNQVFNIVGIVMIIGAIMTIVGLVYNYVR